MCELGNQHLRAGIRRELPEQGVPAFKAAKPYFRHFGVEHTSVDLNGKDGALPLDLTEPIPEELVGTFDVLTNMGTTEHVEDQQVCFENIHNLCREGGLFIHAVPRVGNWVGHNHCLHWYTEEFFARLAQSCGYEVKHLGILNYLGEGHDLIVAVLKKGSAPFKF